jgi:hypothetical protein
MPDTALDRLKRMTAWDQVPTLTSDDLQSLLDRFARVDAAGLAPSEDDWVPTYDFRAAARSGWKLKMGKAAELQSTDLDGNRMSAHQVFEHCREMVKQYSGTASPVTSDVSTE